MLGRESFIPAYGMALADSLLAEHPASHYSVKKILLDMLRREVAIETSAFRATQDDHVITAYSSGEDGSIHEWPALLVNNHTYVLLERFPVKLPEYSEH